MRRSTEVDLPVSTVTVLEDRAQVTRSGQAQLSAGHHRLRVIGFSPVACDRTLVARCEGPGEVVDVRVIRRPVEPLSETHHDAETRRLRERITELTDERVTVTRRRDRVVQASTDLASVAARRLKDLNDDVAWNRPPEGDLHDTLTKLEDERRERLGEQIDLETELERLEVAIADLQRRYERRLRRPDTRVLAEAEIDLRMAEDADVTVHLDYVVANACWRPYHRASVGRSSDRDTVRVETDGCVWQNTGEDWSGVALSLSTERRLLGVEAPTLDPDVLRVRRRPQTMRVETREQKVERVSVEGAPATSGLAGVDDGGEPQLRRAAAPATVPSDGRPHRIPLGGFDAPAQVELWAYPELAEVVHRVAKLENRGGVALLAGPVDIVMDGGITGRTTLAFVGDGEAFELSLGPDPDLRVFRETEEKVDDQALLSSWTRTHHKVTVRLSNLGDRTPRLRVRERVPVSEIEKVRIAVDPRGTTDGLTPSQDGFLDWERVLSIRGTASVTLRYTVERHDDIVMT